MKYINLRELYPDVYKTDTLVEVTEEVFAVIQASDRAEDAYKRRMYRYKAQYSLDCNNGIEKVVMVQPPTPEEILEDKQLREQLYAAVMALPDKQAKRIYAHFYLGMTPKEIAQAEGVDPGRVRDSIRKGFSAVCSSFRGENTFPFAFRLRVTSPGTGLKGDARRNRPLFLSSPSMCSFCGGMRGKFWFNRRHICPHWTYHECGIKPTEEGPV